MESLTVFVKYYLVDGNIKKCVFNNHNECVVLNSEFYESTNDIVIILTYICSPIYTTKMTKDF